jgi:hypothetical protein
MLYRLGQLLQPRLQPGLVKPSCLLTKEHLGRDGVQSVYKSFDDKGQNTGNLSCPSGRFRVGALIRPVPGLDSWRR